MSTTPSTSWMPASGRHRVSVGTSLRRALKARSGTTPPKRSNLPDRDFYSFRYNFKPPSIDSTKPGTIDVKKGKDSTSVKVEYPGSQPGERHIFVGSEQKAKEIDCVLIYDEETGTFTLEKLDSYMTLKHQRKVANPNPLPNAPSTSKQPFRDFDLEAQLERDLLGTDEDADGEPDQEYEEHIPLDPKSLRREEEEEEEAKFVVPTPPPPKTKPARPAKGSAKAGPAHASSSAKYKTPVKSRQKAKEKEKVAALEVEAEDLEFGQPARQTKRIQPSPASPGLALPGSSSVTHPPSTSYGRPLDKRNVSLPPAGSDSEEDWDEVQPELSGGFGAVDVVDVSDSENADEGEDEEEIDMNAFEEEMNQELNGTEHVAAQPMSLNQFAGRGAEASQDEDDYTTSEDSDED